jgi:hypothetical protein
VTDRPKFYVNMYISDIFYRAGSLKTVSRELARYKLDLVGVQEVRWEGGGTEPSRMGVKLGL